MLRGTGTTSSVIHAAGAPAAGVSARPKVLVVLVNTKLPTPAAAASSSSVSVPVTLVSTKSGRLCEPTCGLCSVAGCTTAPAPARQARTVARSVIDPTTVVNGEASTSMPITSCPRARRTRISASPRGPALPVHREPSPGLALPILGTRGVVGWSDAATPDHPGQARPRRPGRGGVPSFALIDWPRYLAPAPKALRRHASPYRTSQHWTTCVAGLSLAAARRPA